MGNHLASAVRLSPNTLARGFLAHVVSLRPRGHIGRMSGFFGRVQVSGCCGVLCWATRMAAQQMVYLVFGGICTRRLLDLPSLFMVR